MNNTAIINEKCCINTKIGVTPDINVGEVKSYCVGKPRFEKHVDCKDECSYMVNQMLCVRFPLTFSARATARTKGCNTNKCNPCHNSIKNHAQRNMQCRRNRNMMCLLFCFLPICCRIGFRVF